MFENLKIGTRFFLLTVLSAVMPIAIVGIVVSIFLSQAINQLAINVQNTRNQIADEVIGENLKNEAAVTVRQVDAYLYERLHEVSEWAASPVIRQSARAASATAALEGLLSLSEEELEIRKATSRSLDYDPDVSQYLVELEKLNPVFSEVFFTDDHGFVVAYSNITSDFVQKGEDWWDKAWETGSYVGPVAYDESSSVYSVEIAVRINSGTGQPLGVLKAVLNINAVQHPADEAAARTTQGIVRIMTKDGYLVADTASNNDPALIMQDAGNLLKQGWAAANQIVSIGKESGYMQGQEHDNEGSMILGYAKTASGDYYEIPGFDGFDWYVIVEQPAEVALASLDSIRGEVAALADMRRQVIVRFVVISLISAVLAMILSYLATRGIVKPIDDLAATGQRFSSGDMDVSVEVRHKNEIGVLESTFQQMIVRLRAMLLSERNEREYMERTVQHYLGFLREVSAGNLRKRLDLDGNQRSADDPLLRLGKDLNGVVDSLRQMILQVQDTATQLATTSTEILAATTQQASGASEQSAAISQTTTTVDEVKTIAEVSALRAQEVADSAQRTVQTSQSGRRSVEDTIQSMTEIKEQVERIAENILGLSEQMQQIGEIITTVNGIASQSNMLALNASVEAARAGEQGRGFAVVAAEVRNLAEQSQQATAQVKAILQDIQKATNTTVMATEEGTKGVERGVRLAYQSRAAIEELSDVINQSAQNAAQMVAAGQQQTAGVEQVALAMNNINQATIQSLASTRQAEKAAHNLHELALHLNETITRYQV